MMRRTGTGLLVAVLILAVPGLPALATGLLAEPVPTWPTWLCAAGAIGFLAIVALACMSPPQHSIDDDIDDDFDDDSEA